MAPPNPAARDSEGAGGKGGNVPGRIGRPPQWTSTRSRKLARLYMYTTLSVDKILKVLEDDVFKPRKNSAQKTIHNMLDHDPRYLRPESREDMNQRIKLLSASTQRTRKSAKDRDDNGELPQSSQLQQQHQQHQQQHQPHQQHQQHQQHPHHQHQQMHQQHQQHPHHPNHHQHHQHQHHPHQTPLSPVYGGSDMGMHQVKQELTQPMVLSQHLHHAQQYHSHQHAQPPSLPPPSTQPATDYFPHPPDPGSMHQQPYADFYHPQYQQQAPPPSQHHALSMQSMTHHVPAYVGGGWPGFYPTHSVGSSAADVEAATRMTISSAPFDLSQHSPAALATAGIHQHGGHHGGHHELGVSLDGSSPTNGMGLPLYAQQQQQQQRERRSSTGACSTASSDVSTETIQDLKKRLSGCSTHYANQVSNLLRRFTISVDSDEAGVPVFEPDTDPHRVRKHRRKNNNTNSSSGNKNHSSGTSNGRKKARSGSVSSDSSAVSNSCASESDGEYDGTFGPGRSSGGAGFHSHSHSTSMSAGDSSDASGQMRDDERKQQLWPTQGNLPVFLGACGDGVGSPRLALPGDFFNAYRYRNEACPHHRRQQQQKQQQQGDGLGGMAQAMGSHGSRLGGRDKKKSRERRYWCAVTEAVSAAAMDNGSFWVLGDGRLAPEAQALLHETAPHSLGRRDRFGHTLLHLFAAREGVQMQLLAMVLNSDDDSIVAANTAGQTFLHLLAPGWFVGLHEPYAPLLQLLAHLRDRRGNSSNGGGGGMGDDTSAVAALAAAAAAASGSSAVSPAHLVYATDVYGRSFFHRLQTFVDDPVILAGIAQPYERAALSRRDAFNNLPLMGGSSGGGGSSMDGSDSGGGVVMLDDVVPPWQSSPPAEGGSSSRSPTPRSGTATATATGDGIDVDEGISSVIFASEDAFIRHHESLLRIVTASDSHPSMEDPVGRNGLHCLAQAIVDKRMMDEHRNAISTGRRPPKKKTMDKRGADLLSPGSSSSTAATGLSTTVSTTTTALSTAPSLSTTPTSSMFLGSPMGTLGSLGSIGGIGGIGSLGGLGGATSSASLLHTSADGPQMATRLRLVQGLLSPPTVVDVNHYDRRGQTVLTSFVVHIADDQEDKAKSLAAILETLLSAGARIDGRNRRGETALLVAARLGRKIALTTLLDHGANVHVRDAAGRGVLDIIDAQCRQRARHDVALYGRLEACRVLLTSIKQLPLGVCQRPTLLDEWTVASSRRGPEPRDMTMVM